jgi:photosystem II stability/assembly factor-like uncharacterized protein
VFYLKETVYAQEGWFTLFTEYGVTTTYTGMQFLNGNTGYLTSHWGDTHNNGGYTQKTINGGFNWFLVESGIPRFRLFFLNQQTGWTHGGYRDSTGIRSREIFKTTNGGASFQRIYIDSLQGTFYRMQFIDANTGWISLSEGLLKSTNSGSNWSFCSNLYLNSFFFIDVNTGWGITSPGNINKTTNGGLNWYYQYSNPGYGLRFITFNNSNTGWACGYPPNIFKTTNAGTNWIAYGTPATFHISNIRFADSLNGWFCTLSGIIFHSTNGGINWTEQYSIADYSLTILAFPNELTGYSFGTYAAVHDHVNNILLKTTTGGVVFVQNTSTEIPDKFSLSQNYPNPFNPVTKITFQIPLSRGVSARLRNGQEGRGVLVRLSIYDALGREVTTLVNEGLSPGTYEVEWDASNYPSGVYFYKLFTGDYMETRKMVLIK